MCSLKNGGFGCVRTHLRCVVSPFLHRFRSALLAFVHGGFPAGVVNYLTRRKNETLRRNELPPKCAATTALLILLRVTGNGGPGLRRRRHARLRPRRRPPRRPGAVVLSVALPLPPPLSSVIAIRPHYFCRPRLFCSPSPFAAVGCSSLLPLTPPFAPPPFTTAAFSTPPSPFVVVARPSFVCRHRISCLPSPFAGAVRLSSLFRRRPPARLPPLTAPLSVAPSAPLSRAKCASASVRKTRPWELGSAPPVVTCGVIWAVPWWWWQCWIFRFRGTFGSLVGRSGLLSVHSSTSSTGGTASVE